MTTVTINGLPVPPFVDPIWVEKMKDMPLCVDDVWVICYPKCGTNWTSQILRLILNEGRDDGKKLSDAVLWVEGFNKNYSVNLDEMTSPRTFRGHFPYELMPCGLPCSVPGKFIYVVRNPKDVLVSSFFYRNEIKPEYGVEKVTWEAHFEKFMAGRLSFGDYFDHVLSWWSHRQDKNILFLKYEDMKKDLPAAVATIAKFIGQDIGQDLIDEIAERTSFTSMKSDSTLQLGLPTDVLSSGDKFFRKGDVGDWKTYFTAEQGSRMDTVYEEKLKSAGLTLDFEI